MEEHQFEDVIIL